jgi:hypothetical protein
MMHAENNNNSDYAYFGKKGRARRQAKKADKTENTKGRRAVRLENRKATAENRRANAANKRSKAESRVILANQGIAMPSEVSGAIGGIASIFGKGGGGGDEAQQQQIESGVPTSFVKKAAETVGVIGGALNKMGDFGPKNNTRTQPINADDNGGDAGDNGGDVNTPRSRGNQETESNKKDKMKKAMPLIIGGIVLVVIVVLVFVFKKKK